jgi:hypothetical protein
MTVREPARLADSHLRSTICYIHTYIRTHTLPPDDGLLMPETCTGILIKSTKNKQCIELVVIHTVHDTRSTQHKVNALLRVNVTILLRYPHDSYLVQNRVWCP